MIDYESLERAVGHNWYQLDPDCRALVRGGCAPDDVEWADAKLSDLGALVGTRVAPNADIVDATRPSSCATTAGRTRSTRSSIIRRCSTRSAATVGVRLRIRIRGRHRGDEGARRQASAIAAAHYLVSQADTGLVCSTGMTSGVAGLVAAYAPPDVRDDLLAGLRAD